MTFQSWRSKRNLRRQEIYLVNGGLGLLTPACHDMMKSANLLHKCGLGDFDMNRTLMAHLNIGFAKY